MQSEQTGLDWFLGAAYNTRLHASLLRDVVDPVRIQLLSIPFDGPSVRSVISSAISRLSPSDLIDTQSMALQRVLCTDLEAILRSSEDEDVCRSIDLRSDIRGCLEESLAASLTILGDLGLGRSTPAKIHFVDDLPAPYESMSGAILAADEGDQSAFGIEPGLYVRPGARPFYTEFLVFHEAVHLLLGTMSPLEYASRLEEGICEVLGSGFVGLAMFGYGLTENLFVLNRLSRQYDASWERYLEAARQTWAATESIGLAGLVSIVKDGREAINQLEDASLLPTTELSATAVRPYVPSDLATLMRRVLLTYPRTLIATPAATLLAPHMGAGASLTEAASASGLSKDLALVAARELQDTLGLLALRSDETVVPFSQAQRVAASGAIRYSIGEQ